MSTVLSALVIAAGAIVWNAATSIDEKVDVATEELKVTQQILIHEITELKKIVYQDEKFHKDDLEMMIQQAR